jgi:hypothetical protein
MRKLAFLVAISFTIAIPSPAAFQGAKSSTEWALNASIIEACSCPMFCQCYFNTKPAGHGGHDHGAAEEHFCRFNNAIQVNRGSYGNVKLDGAKFWVSGDLGGDFSMGQMDWAVVTFDPSVTKEQREGILAALVHLYPVKWKSFNVAKDAPMEWKGGKDRAEARLDGGKIAEVVLQRYPGMSDEPIVIRNLRYFGAPRNDGFLMMPNEVEAYRVGDKPFEYKGTNGFMITVDITSKDLQK